MTMRAVIWLRVVPVILVSLSVSAIAHAQGAPPAPAVSPAAPNAKTEARDRFALGLRLFESGENTAALAEFTRAYELVPNPVVLYNIGLVYVAMDRAVDAVDALDRFLKDGGKATAGEPGHRARQVREEQSKRIAQLMVVTNKPATIEIDGVAVGTTPLEKPLRLTSGAHVVSAVAPGCLPLRQEVTLAGQVTRTLDLTLLPTESNVAHLTVTVAVPGAEVLVNGKSAGTTPLGASIAVPPGGATIEARRAGYQSASQTVKLDEGARGALTLTLVEDAAAPAAMKGHLRLTVSESVPEVIVDGKAQPGSASAGLALIAGPHFLRVQRGGFLPFEQMVEVTAGRDTTLFVSLVPTPETKVAYEESLRTRRVWGWSVVAAGAAVTVGASIFAILTRNGVSDARAELDRQVAMESQVGNKCFLGGIDYKPFRCGEIKAYDQDQLDKAELKRALAVGGIGLGVVTAAVGTYLLMTSDQGRYDTLAAARVSAWGDGQSAGLSATGRF